MAWGDRRPPRSGHCTRRIVDGQHKEVSRRGRLLAAPQRLHTVTTERSSQRFGCFPHRKTNYTETSGDIRNFFVSYLTHILKLTQIRDKPRSNTLMGNFPCERICRRASRFLQSRPVRPLLVINTSHPQRFDCYRMTLPEKHPCAGPFQRLSWPSFLSDARICSAVRAPPSSATRDGR